MEEKQFQDRAYYEIRTIIINRMVQLSKMKLDDRGLAERFDELLCICEKLTGRPADKI